MSNDWVSVNDRFPGEGQRVIVYTEPSAFTYYGIFSAYFDHDGNFVDCPPNCGCTGFGKVTYWMPLPEPPKKDR